MRYLLDTHAFIWFVNNDPALSTTARSVLRGPQSSPLLSMASVWEMAIKIGLGKLKFTQPIERFIPDQLLRNRIDMLPISFAHAVRVATLPHHHRDPFDRMIVIQALVEDLPVVVRDAAFDAYGVRRVW